MKKLLIFLLIGFGLAAKGQNLLSYRTLMNKGVESETATNTLLANSQKAFEESKKPIYQAFHAMGTMLLAKHTGNPIRQISYFRKGKTSLDNAAKADPKNVEIRFMRYLTQVNAPAFLGYNKDIQNDKAFILNEYKNSNDQDLVRRIKQHFKI